MKTPTLLYICDDDMGFCHVLSEKMEKLFQKSYPEHEYALKIFDSGDALLKAWEKEKADVVFLDIYMPGMDGFQVSQEIRSGQEDTIIIYVTNYDDTVYQIWDFQPFWFVRKSKMADVDYLFPRLVQELNRREENKQKHKRLITDREVVEIDVDTVIYIESCNHDIIIHHRDGTATEVRCRILDAAEQLAEYGFGRIQQGIIVNYRFISKINSREVTFLNGEKVNVSRRRLPEIKATYQDFLRRE